MSAMGLNILFINKFSEFLKIFLKKANFLLKLCLYISMSEKLNLRELVASSGMDFPTEEELVMLILGSGTKTNPVEKMANQIIRVVKRTNRDSMMNELMKIDGVGLNKALAICAALELGMRVNRKPQVMINRPRDLVPYVQTYAIEKVEHFLCVTVTGAREILSINVIAIGTGNMASVHPREVFSIAIKEGASGVIFCHNHPGGSMQPSKADINCTMNLIKASEVLGISVLDHIIISKNGFFSFLEHDLLHFDDDGELLS